MLLGQVMTWLAKQRKIEIASLEMYPEETLFRVCCQAGTVSEPSELFANTFIDWSDEWVLIYDQLDKVMAEKILGFIHYCAKELDCFHIVIDSLTKCGIFNSWRPKESRFV